MSNSTGNYDAESIQMVIRTSTAAEPDPLLAVVRNDTPFVTIYQRDGATLTRLTGPEALPVVTKTSPRTNTAERLADGDIMRNEVRELISTLAFIVAFVGFVYLLGSLLQ